ncbi:MAG: hypothetical protein WBW81_07000 [Methylocella sp.]
MVRKPVFIRIGPGLSLGYRRNQVAGTWVLRLADGKGGAATKAIGTADDYEDSNGATVLNYWQAQERAKLIARNSDGSRTQRVDCDQAALADFKALERPGPKRGVDRRPTEPGEPCGLGRREGQRLSLGR